MSSSQTPKVFYGFYIVGACFIVLFFLWGMVLNTFPVFLKPITENMNWGRGALTFSLLMGAIGTAISAPIAGILIDRIGAKPVMTVGTVVIGVGLLAGSRIMHLWQLYIIFAFIGVGLMCASIIPCAFIISNWFVSRRGAAMSGAFVGTSVGGMVMSPIANWIILNYGWRTAFLFSGVTVIVVVIPTVLFLIRTRPSEIGLEPYRVALPTNADPSDNWGVSVKEAFSLPVFWQLAVIIMLIGVVTGGLGNHCPAYLSDLGHSPTQAAFAWSTVMGVMILGKLAVGPVADRWGPEKTTAASCALFAVSIGIVFFAQPYWVVMVFASLYGFACGAPLVLNPLLISGNLGMKNFSAIYGALSIMGTIGGALGPVGAGIYFDKHDTYLPVFCVFIVLMIVTGVVALAIKPVRHGN
ncbi:MAG: MFS transporter [Candidatus Abyssobacteria bacterium SURF_17]|uniref:MFS transporter n=1 Tax=Candidatus Abyssobacteria bacterium SURF_17 TaxID=2093361 RepID=A0A419ET63_9BACT|nr:MAG: MFS transporter [Candidatus Abyssubacteria bacterium SURF_17]